MHTVYKVGARDHHVVEEFNAKPIGHHSPALQRVLNVFRGGPTQDKYVLICTKPHKEWTLGQLTGERGKPVKIFRSQVFTNVEDAEREIFRRRWEQHTEKAVD